MARYLLVLALGLGLMTVMPALAAEKGDLPLVFEEDFEKGADHWQPTDAEAWKITETDRGKVYDQHKGSKYKPPHRSPLNISLLKDVAVTDFVLTVKAKSTCREYGHRDMCLFFGYVDPGHFYYVHLGKKADPHSNQIMIVNDAPRVMITEKKSPGTPWDDQWHQIKIVRKVADGLIEIYFDDMKTPVMTAVDKHFTRGQVGLGSFDDTGVWDDFKLRGIKAEKPKAK